MSSTEAVRYTGTESIDSFIQSRREPDWMKQLRLRAYQNFQESEWPTRQDEEWRRSDISMYDFDSYEYEAPVPETSPAADLPEGVAGEISFHGTQCTGRALREDLEQQGVVLSSLSGLLAAEAEGSGGESPVSGHIRELVERTIASSDNRIYHWHYSAWTHGAVLYVPRFVEIAEPFNLHFQEDGEERLSMPHVVVVLEEGARASVIKRLKGLEEEGEVLVVDGADLSVGPSGGLDYFTLHNLNIDSSLFSNTQARVGRDGHLEHFTNEFGGMFTKTRTDVVLDGTGADVKLDGLYFGHEDQHMDLRTVQYHRAKNANSRTFYRGAVKDEARSVFQGLIAVEHDAVQTDAYLTNNNLILNDGARSDSIPTLQIHTDDVKCSHGSTTGKIDQRQLFYLMARGLPPAEAKRLLLEGFFGELISRTPEALQQELGELVAERVIEDDEEE
jgi:Fe-S cluster assembly protein SufD